MTDWQPIGTAPKDKNVRFLVYRGGEGIETENRVISIENSDNYMFYDWNGFTHWMPLPPPPTSNNN